tara:strand:- start:1195 stop:1488 length:294 start_codon:yes stop_codon:yes gene_type:complete
MVVSAFIAIPFEEDRRVADRYARWWRERQRFEEFKKSSKLIFGGFLLVWVKCSSIQVFNGIYNIIGTTPHPPLIARARKLEILKTKPEPRFSAGFLL